MMSGISASGIFSDDLEDVILMKALKLSLQLKAWRSGATGIGDAVADVELPFADPLDGIHGPESSTGLNFPGNFTRSLNLRFSVGRFPDTGGETS